MAEKSVNDSITHILEESSTVSCEGVQFNTLQMGIKRKPDVLATDEDQQHASMRLYHLTVSKLLTSPRRRVEPSLQRSVVMRNTLKRLECRMFVHTPRKRINLELEETAFSDLHLQSKVLPELSSYLACQASMDTCTNNTQDQPPKRKLLSHQSVISSPSEQSNEVVTNPDSLTLPDHHNVTIYDNPIAATSVTIKGPEPMDFTEIDTSRTPELFSNVKLPSFEEFDLTALNNMTLGQSYCSMDQSHMFSKVERSHMDELDNIMQVLVGM